jgi:hypothetical protein
MISVAQASAFSAYRALCTLIRADKTTARMRVNKKPLKEERPVRASEKHTLHHATKKQLIG